MKFALINQDVKGLLNSRLFVAGLYVLAGAGGLLASWNLAIDRLILLSAPGAVLNCDLSEEVSCGKVDQSWQASLLHWGDTPVPNAFIGMMAYSVLITVGVALASGAKLPRWFNRAALAGQSIMLIFSYWLLSQSFFALLVKLDGSEASPYGALCPWCVMLMSSTTIMTFMLTHFLVLADSSPEESETGQALGLPEGLRDKWSAFIANSFQYLVLIAWLIAIGFALLAKYHNTLLGI